MNNDVINQYILFLIKQYYEKPNANAEIRNLLVDWQLQADFIRDFGTNFDIDNAQNTVLDLIGRIVGLSRQVNDIVPIKYFGFAGNPNSRGFNDGPFFSVNKPVRTPYQLNDFEYRKFLKVKIAKNICSPYLASGDKISLQQVVFDAFGGNAYVSDNKDQTLTLYVDLSVETDEIDLILKMGILPRPITFRYSNVIREDIGNAFAFKGRPNAKGFGTVSDPNVGGRLSSVYA